MKTKRKITIALLALVCVFSAFFAIGFTPKRKPVKASEITFSSSNYYQGITAVNERFSTIQAKVNMPSTATARGCIIGNYTNDLSYNGDFFSLETKASTGYVRYFFRKYESAYANSECTFDYSLLGKGDVFISIYHNRSTGAVTATFITDTETVTKTGTVSTALATTPIPNSLPFCIGNDYRQTTCPFPGTIKSIAMFTSDRTSKLSTDKNTIPTASNVTDGSLLFSYNLAGKGGYTDIKDESGNGHHLKLVSNASSTVKHTKGINFNTAGSMYQTNNVINENINAVEAWINVPTSVGDTIRPGVIWGNYNTISGTQNCLSFEITTGGNPRIYARYNSSNHVTSATFNEIDVRTGADLHLSLVFDRNTQKAYCYVDGVLKQTLTISVTNPLKSDDVEFTDRFAVGGDYRTTSGQPPEQSRFKGTIYSLAVFSIGRTASRITTDMTSIPLNTSGLVALYDFNNKQDSENILDLSGNGNHLVSYSVTEANPIFSEDDVYASSKTVTTVTNTFEAWINMPKTYSGRGGVIIGNYCDSKGITDAINIEITNDGKPRVFARYNNGDDSRLDLKFNYDVRTAEDTHLAITLNRPNQTATLYVNGRVPDGCLNVPFTYIAGYTTNFTNDFTPGSFPFCVGSDHRVTKANSVFKGTIYSVAVFSDIRTQAEILSDIENVDILDSNIVLAYDLKNTGINPTTITDYSMSGFDVKIDSTYIKWNANTTYQQTKAVTKAPKTLEATIKLPSGFTDRAGVITGTYGGGADAFGLEVYTNGHPRLFITDLDSETTNTNLFFNDVNVATGNWVHVAMVIDGTTAKLYIDGALKASQTVTTSSTYVPVFPFGVGGDLRSGNSEYFKGLIKNVAVYSDVRTATEVASDATSTTISTSDLLFGYNLQGVSENEIIQDLSSNDNDIYKKQFWITDDSVTDPTNFDYSFAVVGDTQKLVRQYANYLNNDTTDTSFPQTQTFPKIYDYIINNKTSKKIAHVFGLGDITETGFHWGASEARSDHEFQLATAQFARLDAAGIDYSLVRGNHDAWSKYNQYLGTGADNNRCNYTNSVDEYFTHANGTKDYANSIHYFSAGILDYMVVTLDYGASDTVLAWAKERILANPYKNAIITTHAYMFRDGTTLDVNDVVPPTSDTSSVYDKTNVNNGDDLWNELISQCPNIVLAMSGHDPCSDVVLSQWQGVNGNTVSNMLIDPQGLDDAYKSTGGSGAIAMFYFSNGGKTIDVRFWSTAQNAYIKTANQYTFTIDTVARAQNYSVTWKNGSTTLESDSVIEGSAPKYNGTFPTKTSTAEYTYSFAGWSTSSTGTAISESDLPKVSGNVTYYAIFNQTKNKYTITWKDYNDSILKSETLEYGATPTYSGTPTRDNTAEYTYAFEGWSPSIAMVTKDATYTATYSQTKNKYTITWINYDGSTISSDTLEYGSTISYKGSTPIKEPTAEFVYTFEGWAESASGTIITDFGTVTKNMSYYAIFAEVEIPTTSQSSKNPIVNSSSNQTVTSSNQTQTSNQVSNNPVVNSSSNQTITSSNQTQTPTTPRPSSGCGANVNSYLGLMAIIIALGTIVYFRKKNN